MPKYIKYTGKKGVYNIHEKFQFGDVVWGVNTRKETVTCVLDISKTVIVPVESGCNYNTTHQYWEKKIIKEKYIKTCKASHGDVFDIKTGLARSLFRCMVSAKLLTNMTSWNKVNNTIKRNENVGNKSTTEMQTDNEGRSVSSEGTGGESCLSESSVDIELVSGEDGPVSKLDGDRPVYTSP